VLLVLILVIVVVASGGGGGDGPPATTAASVTTVPDNTTPTTTPAFTVPGDNGGGSDPLLDQTTLDGIEGLCADAVSGQEFLQCDFLFFEAAPGSAQQTFGGSCAGTIDGSDGTCGITNDSGSTVDDLVANCGGGDNAACDELFLITPVGSRLELFGDNCAGRSVDENGGCVASLD